MEEYVRQRAALSTDIAVIVSRLDSPNPRTLLNHFVSILELLFPSCTIFLLE
jgi:hypothetical protein